MKRPTNSDSFLQFRPTPLLYAGRCKDIRPIHSGSKHFFHSFIAYCFLYKELSIHNVGKVPVAHETDLKIISE